MDNENLNGNLEETEGQDGEMQQSIPVSGMYKNWFLDYASYVILDRAVPYIEDGLKPVQRRILHAMKEMEDGRYNKVANIIGQTMQYHPHGDQAISGAIVNLGQKDLLIDTQGNWGNILTGDSAAAPRYIEARLSKFALDTVFNPKTTEWQMSYDGRKNEPVTLPVKFPLVLAQGVEGIAVGLSTKIMPHNFIELCKASIAYLRGRSFQLYPDFPTAGMMDVENYQLGHRGGKIRVRARIVEEDKKTLKITEIPYGTTTTSVMDSIVKANDKGKIKIKKVEDQTARNVEILVHLPSGVSPDITIDALYAFTNCEVSISPNCCIIVADKPVFTDIRTVLKQSTDNTVALLKLELEIRQAELREKWHLSSLEKIFIENRIYRDIEEVETWEGVIETIDAGLAKFVSTPSTVKKNDKRIELVRDITREDIIRLTEIKIKRISKYDSFKADELIKQIETDLDEVAHHLAHLTDFAVNYFENLLKKYSKGKERKTEIRNFGTISKEKVVLANEKLYANLKDGFIGIGSSIKKEGEFISECSDIDDIIVFRKDGKMLVTRVQDKSFVGKNIIHVAVWRKGDDRTTYHLIYQNGGTEINYVKRFQVKAITRDKEYELTQGIKGTKVLHFSCMGNGEAEVVTVSLKGGSRARKMVFDYDFGDLTIKGRTSKGNTLVKYPIRKIEQKLIGPSTLPGIDIWYDPALLRINTNENGEYIGNFNGADRIIVLYDDGSYELTTFELTNHYDGKGKVLEVAKLTAETVISAIHFEGKNGIYYVKRFKIETSSIGKKYPYISSEEKSRLVYATAKPGANVKVKYTATKVENHELKLDEFIDIKGWKAIGNKLSESRIGSVQLLSYDQELLKEQLEEQKKAAEISFEVVDARTEVDEDQTSLF